MYIYNNDIEYIFNVHTTIHEDIYILCVYVYMNCVCPRMALQHSTSNADRAVFTLRDGAGVGWRLLHVTTL